jgi:hypothetical protein
MKRVFMFLFTLAMVLGFCVQGQATLTTIGQAQYGAWNYNLIWDNDSPFGSIVWLDDTQVYNTWANRVAWANGLNTAGTLTYTIKPLYSVSWKGDWRLPKTVDGPYVWGYNGTTTAGYNITSSEMGHLFYMELGNKGYYATDGTHPQPGWNLFNRGPFTYLTANGYWTGTEHSLNPNDAWYFGSDVGAQGLDPKGHDGYALAVRPGDVSAVPVPGTVLLLGSGLIGLAGLAREKFKKQIQ